MLEKTLLVGEGEDAVEVRFKASAALPRLYMAVVHRDLIKDFASLQKTIKQKAKSKKDSNEMTVETSDISMETLIMFENIAYVMAYHACNDEEKRAFPKSADEWLEQFTTFSIYEILPEIMELWAMNESTSSVSKKK